MSLRVRLIRPAYWTDADLHTRLSADAREFYVGLWMEADDAGFVAWDLDRLGAELYPFRPLAWRRRHLVRWGEALSINGHVRVLECGRHAVIPNLTKYQNPPKPSFPNRRAHEACRLSHVAPVGASGHQRGPALGFSREGGLVGKEGKGLEGGARGAEDGSGETTTSEFRAKYAAAATEASGTSRRDQPRTRASPCAAVMQPMPPTADAPAEAGASAPVESWFEPAAKAGGTS